MMEGKSQQGKQKRKKKKLCGSAIFSCGAVGLRVERELWVKTCDSGRSQTASRL